MIKYGFMKTQSMVWRSAQASSLTTLPRPVYFRAYQIPGGTHVQPHRHPWHHFIYARDGVMRIQANGGSFIIPPLFAVWLPAGVMHEAWTLDNVDLESLFIEADKLTEDTCRVVCVDDFARAFIHHANSTLPQEYEVDGAEGKKVDVLLDILVSLPAASFNLPYPRHAPMAKMCLLMQKSPGEAHLMTDWAEKLHMAPRTFSRRFQEETGLSFSTWWQRLRLLHSIVLFREGQTVTAVALTLGYRSPSAFAHAFGAMFGASPRKFLKQ